MRRRIWRSQTKVDATRYLLVHLQPELAPRASLVGFARPVFLASLLVPRLPHRGACMANFDNLSPSRMVEEDWAVVVVCDSNICS